MVHHRRGLRRLLENDALLGRIDVDWRSAGLDARRAVMLGYAEKLTLTPGQMDEADVVALRKAGFVDRDILDICEVVAYFAYVNRIADGLGVTLETWIDE
jgi:uncharacterized peroxidase-related enzyme